MLEVKYGDEPSTNGLGLLVSGDELAAVELVDASIKLVTVTFSGKEVL